MKRLLLMGVFGLLPVSEAQIPSPTTCPPAQAKLKTLDASLIFATGCPAPTIGQTSIPTVEAAAGNAPVAPCAPNAAAEKAWHTKNDAELNKLTAFIGRCDLMACPAIPMLQVARPGVITATSNDLDGDGIPDDFETKLIERFSPFLRFSLFNPPPVPAPQPPVPEAYRPADPLWYLSHSRLVYVTNAYTVLPQSTLQTNPRALLGGTAALNTSANLLDSFGPNVAYTACASSIPRSPYHVDPVDDTAHGGADWQTVMQARNVGLFAHVSKFHPRSAEDLPGQMPPPDPKVAVPLPVCGRKVNGAPTTPVIFESWYEGNCKDCYKIEYYQFFGKNADYESGIGDHEGDWSLLTVVYENAPGAKNPILAVSHWAHGYEMRFDLMQAQVTHQVVQDPIVGEQMQWIGLASVSQSFNILKIENFAAVQDQPELAQTNTLFLAKDPVTGEFAHPVAFVEYGSHEFWPTSKWGAQGAPAHPGDDKAHSYLSHNIPNLGEIEHPMSDEAAVILGYNGSWGYVNNYNNPPPGPALHKTWNWFAPNRTPIECGLAE